MKYFIETSVLKHNRNFRWLYIGQFVSLAGTMITSVALPYQIYHLTHSTLMVGLISLCQLLPLLVTALLGGVCADRSNRRILLFVTEASLAIGCGLLAFNSVLAQPQVWIIFIVATLMSAINGFHRPALDSITQQIVRKQDLPAISALKNLKYSVCMIVGPAIGGLIIANFGIFITYIVDLTTFLISLLALLLMSHIPSPDKAEEDESTWQSLKQGLTYAVSRQELLGTYIVDFFAMIFGMPTALFPAIAENFGGAQTLGLLYAAPAVGALILSFFTGWTKHVTRHGMAIALAACLWGVSIIFFGLSSNLWIALFFLALSGAFDSISAIFRVTMWNETVPNKLRGRLAGIEMIGYLSGPRLGDTEAGLVAAAFGITASIVSGGVLCVVGVAACCYYLPKFWGYRSTIVPTETAAES